MRLGEDSYEVRVDNFVPSFCHLQLQSLLGLEVVNVWMIA